MNTLPENLGPYRIIRKLGEGAMGVVYKGVNEELGQVVAVKVLAPSVAQQRGFRFRFEAEIESLRKLSHGNIVRLFGFGEQDDQLFYAMEFVEGAALDQLQREGRTFSWHDVIDIGKQTCKALKHAHDRGIIHRDIKPSNLMLSAEGQVKLADFGVARLYGMSGATVAGGTIGTASYMAPEQAEGGRISERADLYALGGVMYTLLAGRPPLIARTLPEMIRKLGSDIPEPVRHYCPHVPPELDVVIANLLQKDPAERVANANVLYRSLQQVEDAVTLRRETMARYAGVDVEGDDAEADSAAPMKEGSTVSPGEGDDEGEGEAPAGTLDRGAAAEAETVDLPAAPGRSTGQTDPPVQAGPRDPRASPHPPHISQTDQTIASDARSRLPTAGASAGHDDETGAGQSRLHPDQWQSDPDAVTRDLPKAPAPDASHRGVIRSQPSQAEAQPKHDRADVAGGSAGGTSAADVADASVEPGAAEGSRVTFITRDQADEAAQERAAEMDRRRPVVLAAGPIVLAIVLAVVVAMGVYSNRRESPEQMIAHIEALDRDGSDAALRDARDRIEVFERLYPDHPQQAELDEVRRKAELMVLRNQSRNRARDVTAAQTGSPIERAYIEALSVASHDPDRALRQLDALLMIYAAQPDHADPRLAREIDMFRTLAADDIGRLRGRISQYRVGQVKEAMARLDYAQANWASSPDECRRICESVILLFDQRWAADQAVSRARALLARESAPVADGGSDENGVSALPVAPVTDQRMSDAHPH